MQESNKVANAGKYIVKFVNGFWVSFNTETYENTHLHYLKRDAVEFTKKLNQKEVK